MTPAQKEKWLEQWRLAQNDAAARRELELQWKVEEGKDFDPEKDLPEGEQQYMLPPTLSFPNWNDLLEDYKKKFHLEPVDNNTLVFQSDEEAMQFFQEQADLGREFLLQKHEKGQATGFFVFSCGDKNVYKGSLSDIHAALQIAVQQDPNNLAAKNGVKHISSLLSFKQRYQGVTNPEPPQTAPSPEPQTSSAPNPLSTTPKPVC